MVTQRSTHPFPCWSLIAQHCWSGSQWTGPKHPCWEVGGRSGQERVVRKQEKVRRWWWWWWCSGLCSIHLLETSQTLLPQTPLFIHVSPLSSAFPSPLYLLPPSCHPTILCQSVTPEFLGCSALCLCQVSLQEHGHTLLQTILTLHTLKQQTVEK